MRKVERLVNLVALLLDTHRPLTLDQVAELVPGYEATGESLRRMFERDKEELRGLGVPVERGPIDPWGSEEGYFIDPNAYAMPRLDLAPDERAALALAARAWSGAAGDPSALAGLSKLDLDPGAGPDALRANLDGASPLLATLIDAVTRRKRIVFTYRPPGRSPSQRQVDPYALVHRRGTWYVAGHDSGRGALRSFRLSRIQSAVRMAKPSSRGPEFEVPDWFDPSDVLPTAGEPDASPIATVRAGPPSPGGPARAAGRGAEVSRGPEASAAGRLQRLLALVPWVMAHPESTVDEVCARFAMTREALAADLELLFMSGVPPYGPGDLMEAWIEGERVHIGLADYFARAPRLTWREAAGLYLAGRALASLRELDEHGALERALAKLETVLPSDQLDRIQELASRVSVDLGGGEPERAHRAMLSRAAAANRRVVLEYYSGSRGDLSRRKVDPWLVFATAGHWYMVGHCHRAGGERLFRLDRVVEVTPTEEPFERPASFDPASYSESPWGGAFSQGLECELDLGPQAAWVADWLPILSSRRRPDGRLRIKLATHELAAYA